MDRIESELREGMGLAKCRECGCMKETLENLHSSLPIVGTPGTSDLRSDIEAWLTRMEPTEYACLGCDHCYPAVATNAFNEAFPEAADIESPACVVAASGQEWPPVAGEYFAFCDGEGCPVAVSTLGSVELAERLASTRPRELCIVGKTETENIGIDKVVKNTIANPTIRFLVLTGKDPAGHRSGATLLALSKRGVDERMRVIGSPGKRPILRNVTSEEVRAFREQIQVVDLIGCEDVDTIVDKLAEIAHGAHSCCSCESAGDAKAPAISTVEVVQAKEPKRVQMDRAGYFVVIPQPDKRTITVEHYAYDSKLLRVVEGDNARALYSTIVDNGWVTQLSHAAYLGKELAKAQLSLELGFRYVQDGA